MKKFCFLIISFLPFLLLTISAKDVCGQSGCPAINAGPDVTVGCGNNCTTLSATIVPTGATSSYGVTSIPYNPPFSFNGGTSIIVNIDDRWSSAITLPFSFCFYGNTYNQVVVGSNGVLTFNASSAGGMCPWSYSASCPSSSLPLNAIYGVYQDTDPTYQGMIDWQLSGAFPCRMFVISFYQLPYFGGLNSVSTSYCTSPPIYATSQIVLYESTNVIEVYIQDKYVCTGWNSGNGLVGIQDATGTNGITPPGRNTGAWTAYNEAWRIFPNGTAGYTITWFDGTTILGVDSTGVNPYSIQVCPTDTTTYTAQAVYYTCTGNNVTVTDQVTVNYNGNFSISANPTSDTLCQGQNVTLNATAPPNVTLTWAPSAGLNTTNGPTVVATPANTTTYTVTGVDPTNCSMSVPITITVNPMPAVTVTPSNPAICSGDSVTMTAHGASTYLWSPPTGLSSATDSAVIANPALTTTYTITGVNPGNCSMSVPVTVTVYPMPVVSVTPQNPGICSGTSVAITAHGASSYSWSPPNGLSSTTDSTVIASPVSTTTYTVVGLNPGNCSMSVPVTVTVNPTPVVTVTPPNATLCGLTSVTLTAHGANTYSWSPPNGLSTVTDSTVIASPGSSTTYTVTGFLGPCSSQTSVTVLMSPNFSISVSPPNPVICGGNSVILTASGANTYAWSPPDYLSSTSGATVTASPPATTTYTVIGSNILGCTSSVLVTVKVLHLPSVDLGPDICITHDTILNAQNIGFHYMWNTGDTTQTIIVSTPGTYSVTVAEQFGYNCQSTSNVHVTIFPVPHISLGPDSTMCSHQTIKIEAADQNGYLNNYPYTISWSPFPPADANDPYIVLSWLPPETYTVVCRVTGCATYADSMILTINACDLTVPNIFTPNGDGVNDYFFIKNLEYYPNSSVVIFNRWGRKVYENSDYKGDWDGSKCADGVYYYVLIINYGDRGNGVQTSEQHGTVTILR